tara:strand:- start:22472 stop:23374 length:903 start_codon:yes stop_codon:yes gene_type:complete
MLSICIPLYNMDIQNLYDALKSEIKVLNEPIEIIVIDDCSLTHFKTKNRVTCKQGKYIELSQNVGRAKIRNLFLDTAYYENLLFLDCDGLIIDDHFINNYLKVIKNVSFDVICGGRVYLKQKPNRKYLLNWEHGIKKESKPYEERRKNAYQSFMTNNFIIKKSVFETIRFDEKITTYGHEDTLFGFLLKQKNKTIIHINNPVLNGDNEANKIFLQKTEDSVQNLIYILNNKEYSNSFIDKVKLLKIYSKLQKNRFISFYNIFFFVSKPLMRFLLSEGIYGSLIIFDLYKLGVLIKLKNKV